MPTLPSSGGPPCSCMADTAYEPESELPPPGNRWGAGAQSVLPYLTTSLQSKPASAPEHARDARPREQPEGPSFSPERRSA